MQKIIVADRNRLLREMLTKAIGSDENLEIVRILKSYDQLYDHVQKQEVDWVIVSFSNGQDTPSSTVKKILASDPAIGVIIVSPDGSHVRARQYESQERVLDGINLEDLIRFLSKGLDNGEEISRRDDQAKGRI